MILKSQDALRQAIVQHRNRLKNISELKNERTNS